MVFHAVVVVVVELNASNKFIIFSRRYKRRLLMRKVDEVSFYCWVIESSNFRLTSARLIVQMTVNSWETNPRQNEIDLYPFRYAKCVIVIVWSIGKLMGFLGTWWLLTNPQPFSALATASPIPIVSSLNQPTDWFKKCDRWVINSRH